MQDVVFTLVVLVFFVLAWLFVMACDRIIGPDEEALAEGAAGAPPDPAATENESLAA